MGLTHIGSEASIYTVNYKNLEVLNKLETNIIFRKKIWKLNLKVYLVIITFIKFNNNALKKFLNLIILNFTKNNKIICNLLRYIKFLK